MVYRIVELHDGEVEVQSTPGRGTRFRLIFPQLQRLPPSARSDAGHFRDDAVAGDLGTRAKLPLLTRDAARNRHGHGKGARRTTASDNLWMPARGGRSGP